MIQLDIHKTLKAVNGNMDLQLNLEVQKGQLVTLYGDSGAGKTSTLRMLSGLLKPDSGYIKVNDTVWFDSETKINLSPQQRNIGYVFQDYALFPNMTVRQNLEFALQSNQDNTIIPDIIDIIEIGELQHRSPNTLSGGQKQRVALARALVQQPKLLLLDEPLAALDINIRLKLQDYILKVRREYDLTTILISHDISEIIKLSDVVFVIEEGRIIKRGTPEEVFIGTNISNDLKLVGEVLKIENKGSEYTITALVQANIITIPINASEAEKLKTGDKIVITPKEFHSKIHKVN
ncbi:ATP-binding cassette domain-containing protein [Flavobacteriaceae bacterium R38]|nr:ATP-binding cassette domain-containing protein [Flavobacteriaceae bacterium R38]